MKRILACDDQALNLRIYRAFLYNDPYELHFAASGAQAVAAVRGRDFALVLMDIMMPGMDGIEAARRIRRLPPPRGTTPIVAITSLDVAAIEEECLAAGMNGFLGKPVRREILLAAIAKYARD